MATAAAPQIITSVAALSGIQRAAVLLMYLDREVAKEVLNNLTSDDLQELGHAIAQIDQIRPDVIEQVVAQFVVDLHEASMVPTTGQEFALKVFPNLLPNDMRRRRVEGALRRELSTEFKDLISSRPPATVAAVLRDEHPQTMAVAMLLMGSQNAAPILRQLEEKDRMDVVLRMARIRSIPGDLADEVEKSVRSALDNTGDMPWEVQGIDLAAKLVGRLDRDAMEELLEEIYAEEPELSEHLRRRMVVFEDLAGLQDRAVQTLLKNIERDTLVVALRGADLTMRNLIMNNMSSRAAQDIQEEIEILGPVPRASVEKAQEEIVEAVVRLSEEGVITLPMGDGAGDMV